VSEPAPHTRFDDAFSARAGAALPGLIPYVTAGFPALDDTVRLLQAMQRSGGMAAEVGIPFSDPLADGPTIQRAGWRALQNGVTLHRAIEQVAAARSEGVTLPLALMTYINPVLTYGVAEFARDAERAGIDGVIAPDLPAGEAEDVRNALHACGVALIPLVAPTTPPERLARICADAGGFIYCVSVTGVTGSRDTVAAEALGLLDAVRTVTSLPRALGFGLSQHAHLQALAGHAEAAVVASALIDAIDRRIDEPVAALEDFCRTMLGTGATSPA
jgi:tryptophan synthase alpha chain